MAWWHEVSCHVFQKRPVSEEAGCAVLLWIASRLPRYVRFFRHIVICRCIAGGASR